MFWLLTFSFGMIAWLILVIRAPLDPNLQIGKPSPVTMQASHDARYYSSTRTEEARTRAESDPSTVVYTRDTAVPTQQRNLLSELLTTVTQIRDDPTLSANDRRVRLAELPNSTLVITSTMADTIVTLKEEEWKSARQLSTDLYDMAMREYNFALTDQDVKNLRERSLPYWAAERADGAMRDLVISLTTPFLKANQLVDEDATRKRKQEAREAIQPLDVQLLQGESIVRAGDLITPDVLEKLEALGELEGELNIMRVLGRGIFAWLAASVLGGYLAITRTHVRRSRRYTLVIYSLTLITLALARMVIGLPLGESWPYAFPLGAAVLLITALFDSGIALVVAIVLSFLIAFIDSSSFGLNVALLLSSTAGVFALGRANRSLRFLIAGLALATVVALVQIALWATNASQISPQQMPMILAMSLLNGTLASILALGLYNLLGQIAGVVTPFQLMELSNPTQPLLRKLIREAPGTYYHSVTVGNLAESAAELIGADALLLRVAAYYHDVGKSARPYFYTDNQNDRENVHNELDPRTSAQIIADHVREGVNMARAAHLPIQIIEFIQTHHGTSIIQHFYQMALREQDTVDVADFRYPGPKPQTREHAILMLADSVEATVRSKSQHGKLVTPRQRASGQGQPGAQTLEEMVSFIIDERIRSGQLDESPLTLHELACIRQAFITTLQGIYHPRVEYAPQLVKTT